MHSHYYFLLNHDLRQIYCLQQYINFHEHTGWKAFVRGKQCTAEDNRCQQSGRSSDRSSARSSDLMYLKFKNCGFQHIKRKSNMTSIYYTRF